jgi:hypothetical protein
MKVENQQICPPFVVGCNVYTKKTYDIGFSDAMQFVNGFQGLIDEDKHIKIIRYLGRRLRSAYHHFREEPYYAGAKILGMKVDKKFVTIDAWLTKLVIDGEEFVEVDIDAECMILCKCGHCLTRQEAKGTDPFVMNIEELERRAIFYRGVNREYRKYDV